MTACKQTASTGADLTMDEADSNSAAKRDGAEERKPWIKCRKGKKAKGKLAVKSNGAEKPKTHDLSDVTRGLAMMSTAEDEKLDLLTYQNYFWMKYFKDICDKPSVDAVSSTLQCLLTSIRRHNDLFQTFNCFVDELIICFLWKTFRLETKPLKSGNPLTIRPRPLM